MNHLKNILGGQRAVATTPSADREIEAMRDRTGFVQRLKADHSASRAAGGALKLLQVEQVTSEANIALTTLKLAEVKLRTALVADSMSMIGATTVRLGTATAAVDQALTSSSHAAMLTALALRQQSRSLFTDLQRQGHLTGEERELLAGLVEQDAAEDINRARSRMNDAKQAIGGLHAFAQQGIADAKDKLI